MAGEEHPSASVCSSLEPPDEGFCYLLTNLPATRYPLDHDLSRLQCAGKWNYCLKNGNPTPICTPLHQNAAIVEGLIWTAMLPPALKRFWPL